MKSVPARGDMGLAAADDPDANLVRVPKSNWLWSGVGDGDDDGDGEELRRFRWLKYLLQVLINCC